jgi:ABC-2 type transport system ATP-binding protein
MTAALEGIGLGKRYGLRRWALRDLDIAVDEGTITALVGPNGSGKSTLLKAWVGFERPTSGRLNILGVDPVRHRGAAVRLTGYVPQQPSLYRELSVADHLAFATVHRPGFDAPIARHYLDDLSIPLDSRAEQLSGGQQAQVGLALALGSRAPVLLLDEPLASLDPLARREFLQDLMEAVAEHELTVVLSSHLVSDLERVCDHLIVLVASRVQLAGDIDTLLADHHRLTGARRDPASLPADQHVISASHTDRQSTLLVRTEAPIHDPAWTVGQLSLEDLVLAYMGQPAPNHNHRPALEVLR